MCDSLSGTQAITLLIQEADKNCKRPATRPQRMQNRFIGQANTSATHVNAAARYTTKLHIIL